MIGAAALCELVWTHYGVNPQTSPDLCYPAERVPALAQSEQAPRGRICGFNCLPACLNRANRLRDIRGYDGVIPASFVELFMLCKLQRPNTRFYDLPYAAVLLDLRFSTVPPDGRR